MWIVKKKRQPEHKCRKPFNWLGLTFAIGSVWACDGCNDVYIYKRDNSYGGGGQVGWAYMRQRTVEDNDRFLDNRIEKATNG